MRLLLDLDFGVSEVIGDRAFSSSPEDVTKLAGAFITGMREAGMASTGKHFPGHAGLLQIHITRYLWMIAVWKILNPRTWYLYSLDGAGVGCGYARSCYLSTSG